MSNWNHCLLFLTAWLHWIIGSLSFTETKGNFDLNCTLNYTFSRVVTMYSNEDRSWSIYCKPHEKPITLTDCEWSNWVNDITTSFLFECHNEAVITGIFSIYSSYNERGRRFMFYCCEPSKHYVAHSCYFTPFLNRRYALMNYRIPNGWYLRGVYASELIYGDRRYAFQLCLLDQIQVKDPC